MQVTSSFIHLIVEHKGENKNLNKYHMSEINYFKFYYYTKLRVR
jgi:hypothetical protein